MNDYFGALSADMPNAEQPNDWSKMLMSLANQNNSWSAEQAQRQMDFQREMSNTAHQREVADLKAAGLNPILSAKLGGASTPSGASATADTSVVSSMVQLMNKMLDVQGTSAAAAYNASGGANATYGFDTGNSGFSTISEQDQAELANALSGKRWTDKTIQAIKNAVGSAINNAKVGLAKADNWLGEKTGTSMKDAGNWWKDTISKGVEKVKSWFK